MTELLRFEGKILSGTVSREADRWFVSIAVDAGDFKKERIDDQVIGVDLGIKALATFSTGEQIANPKHLQGQMRLLKRRSRQHSRKKKGSSNRRKSALRLARLHRNHKTFVIMIPKKHLNKVNQALKTVFGNESAKDFVPYLDTKLRGVFS